MNAKSIWIGLAGCWLVVGVIAGLFFVNSEESGPPMAPHIPVANEPENGDDARDPIEVDELELDQPQTEKPGDETESKEITSKVTTEETRRETTEPGDKSRETEPINAREDLTVEPGGSETTSDAQLGSVSVPQGGKLYVTGEVSVDGDWINKGEVTAGKATLVFDGTDQTIEGDTIAGKVILRGGTKRIRSGTLTTSSRGNADPGEAQLVVEEGTTLIIEEDGKWKTPNAYGFHIAGHLIIDGGEFHCSFSNGNGTDRGAEAWVDGSTLTIYSGRFVGGGDADFSGCAITIHDGALEINDDIWNSGDELTMYGGLMRNRTGGGMFYLTGNVNIMGGELHANQNNSRSLRIAKGANIFCTGGKIVLGGRDASTGGGILLGEGATLPDMTIQVSTRIHQNSNPNAWLTIGGTLEIAKGHKFEAHGHNVFTNFVQTEDSGQFIP